MNPSDLGLPVAAWRPHQIETATAIAGSSSYCCLVDAPTGSGKSVLGIASAKLLGARTVYLVTAKSLQDQIAQDFPDVVVLKGRKNYPCALRPDQFPEFSADTCTEDMARLEAGETPCHAKDRCQYMNQKRAALAAKICCLNTAYFLTEANYVGGFSGVPFLVADEVDTMEAQLMSFISLVITRRQIDRFKLPMPKHKTVFTSWMEWAGTAASTTANLLPKLEKALDPRKPHSFREYHEVQRFHRKLLFFQKEVNNYWVWYPGTDRWEFKPVWVSPYAKSALWQHAERVLGMSATILDPQQLGRNLGLLRHQISYTQLPSLFPPEKRRIYYDPVAKVTLRNEADAFPLLARKIGQLLEAHSDEKMLIHTVSYRLAEFIRDNVSSERLVFHQAEDRAEKLEEFRRSAQPLVLVSPSMERGYDFPNDACRVVIVCKLPFPYLGDPQVKRRLYSGMNGQRWYSHTTACALVQMTGRHVRSVDDFGISYLLDESFDGFFKENKGLFPQWWQEALVL